MLGLNPRAARHAGVRVAALSGTALAVSGAFAGIAGAVLLTSPVGTNRLQGGISNNIGWDGLLVALVARNRPLMAIPVALLFGVLRSGEGSWRRPGSRTSWWTSSSRCWCSRSSSRPS